jgi:hypothetical protein
MYCDKLDTYMTELVRSGAVKLPSVLNAQWRSGTYQACIDELGNKSYGENLAANLQFLEQSSIITSLLPTLMDLAEDYFGMKVSKNDVYNVCRLVRPGDTSEGYRGHYDSHLFTLVTPINIPNFESVRKGGQLHYFPNARKRPRNEFQNIFGKVVSKRFNSESGFEKLSKRKIRIIDDFQDYSPLLFIGNTTFHGNSPIEVSSNENRMTILTHFFDPSPKYGIGAALRKLRRR